jgi:hypothetical protein
MELAGSIVQRRVPPLLPPALLALAACATGVPVQREVVVSGARFQAVQGEARLTVRTFLPDAPEGRREVLGAHCDVVSSLYSTQLVTPARLVVPNFGPQSPELAFACRAGELSGSARVSIFTRWEDYPWGPPAGPWGWGPYPGWGMWGGWGWGGPAFPVSEYPDVAVELR